jgi:hypothetical protein
MFVIVIQVSNVRLDSREHYYGLFNFFDISGHLGIMDPYNTFVQGTTNVIRVSQ